MKGLLIKDFCILKNQIRFFVIVFGMGLVFLFTNESPEAAMGYITVLASMLVLTTMSYDEFEKGMSFLMTLPVSKAVYVWEKYVLGIIIGTGMSFLTALVAFFVFKIRAISYPTSLYLHSGFLIWGISYLFLAIMIPVQLKFRSEKGRYAKLVVIVVASGVSFLVVKALSLLGIDVIAALKTLLNTSMWLGFAAITTFCMVLYVVSAFISLGIMKKKEF